MIRIQQLKLPVSHDAQTLLKKVCKSLRCTKDDILSYEIVRQSLDARKKPELFYVYTVDVSLKKESAIFKKVNDKNIMLTSKKEFQYLASEKKTEHRPVIIGCGPAGLFCAYYLAKAGLNPIVFERGADADTRKIKVEKFWETGILDTECNVQFGEGGAGTFSDGKLNTLVKDPVGRNKEVLKIFAAAGAPKAIIYEQKPHLGTDQLIFIVKNLRHQIEEMGGEIHFESKMTDVLIGNGKVSGVVINENRIVTTDMLVLAIGHSARDTFYLCKDKNMHMEAKSFAVGVRAEHPQTMINRSQYGVDEHPLLGAANYKLTHQTTDGRGVYSFCMCPGGYVVNASSEEGMLAVNGMSYHDRGSQNANSALIVTVTPDDFGSDDVLAGVEFQRRLEKKAFELGNGSVPVQLFKDFKENKCSTTFGKVKPCIKGAFAFANLRELFPEKVNQALIEGITAFDKKIHGFSREDAVLSGVESRTSSPLRMVRDEKFMGNIAGIYPCGEGAGYAGGITSAAMDGLKVGEAIVKNLINL